MLAENTHGKYRKNNKCNKIPDLERQEKKPNKKQDLVREETKKGPEMSANIAKNAKVTRIFSC